MKYTITDLRSEFPDDDACLHHIFREKYPDLSGYCRIRKRKSYANAQGHQVHPLKGTIFEKSSTPLTLWFHAIYLFSVSKNGVSAKEIQRQLGVTYKTAWRMANRIRSLTDEKVGMLSGTVEVDETYIGGRHRRRNGFRKKAAIMGMVERGGRAVAKVIAGRETHLILNQVIENVDRKSSIMSDEAGVYKKLPRIGYQRSGIKHGKRHWVRGNVHTNTVEGLWSCIKPCLKGTHRSVSKTHLQSYVDEFVWRYNHRKDPRMFRSLLGRVTSG